MSSISAALLRPSFKLASSCIYENMSDALLELQMANAKVTKPGNNNNRSWANYSEEDARQMNAKLTNVVLGR